MKLLGFEDLKDAKGIPYSRVHLWRLIKAKQFPMPVALGPGRKAWLETEIDEWIRSRAAARDDVAA